MKKDLGELSVFAKVAEERRARERVCTRRSACLCARLLNNDASRGTMRRYKSAGLIAA